MTSKSEKALLKALKLNYKKKWGAPVGQRKCHYNLSDECLGVEDEDKFTGHKCMPCSRQMQRERYYVRAAARGYPKQKPGPKKKVEEVDSE